MSHLFFSCTAARWPSTHASKLPYGLLLNVARPPRLDCDASTSEYCETSCERPTFALFRLLLNISRLLRLDSARGFACWLLGARLSFHALSSQACHLLEVRTIKIWTLRFCIPLLSWDFGIRPCTHTATSFLDLREELPGLTLLEHLHTLLFLGAWSHWVALGFSATLRQSAVGHAIFRGFLGPGPWLVSLWAWVPTPGCFTFFTAIWHVFHPTFCSPPGCFIVSSNILLNPWTWWMSSKPTSPSGSQLLFNPWNQLNSDVMGFGNTRASRDNRNHHLPTRTGMSTTLSKY